MSMASPEIQNLAQRLFAFEAAHDNALDANAARDDVAVQIVAELRRRLIKLAGVDGFRSLLSRALALAKAEVPALQNVRVGADGSLEGFDGVEPIQEPAQAGRVLVTHLLELMVAFIGESLTLRLVRDAWPDASLNEANSRTEETR